MTRWFIFILSFNYLDTGPESLLKLFLRIFHALHFWSQRYSLIYPLIGLFPVTFIEGEQTRRHIEAGHIAWG